MRSKQLAGILLTLLLAKPADCLQVVVSPWKNQARIGQRTGAPVKVIRPEQQLSTTDTEQVRTVPADGMLVAIGGHNSAATNKILANLALQKAGGLEPRLDVDVFAGEHDKLKRMQATVKLLVLTQASRNSAEEKRKDALSMFEAAGIPPDRVTVLSGEVTKAIPLSDYSLVYMTGGDQKELRKLVSDETINSLHDYLNHGGIIAGTSAGTAIMSEHMIAGDRVKQDGSLTPEVVDLANGFGFLQALSLDMHLFQYRRFARPLAALALMHDKPAADDVVLALGQDSMAVIQAVKLDATSKVEGSATVEGIATGAVKVTIAGSTQSWLYQAGPAFASNLVTRSKPTDLADVHDVHVDVFSPGSMFILTW